MGNVLCDKIHAKTVNSRLLCDKKLITLVSKIGTGEFGVGIRHLYRVDGLGLGFVAERDLDGADCQFGEVFVVGKLNFGDCEDLVWRGVQSCAELVCGNLQVELFFICFSKS
jgi:hypothetical protein